MRLFIAIELPETIKSELAGIQSKLKASRADVKWVEPQNIHLTLKFLGYVQQDKIAAIKNAVDKIAGQTKAFNISLSEIGAFPDLNSPRVIWVGIDDVGAGRDLPLLVDVLANELSKLDFPKEKRPFSAHLTLGRIHSSKGKENLKELIEDINEQRRGEPMCSPQTKGQTHWSAPTHIDHIALFQSTLTPKGPVYTNLYEARLRPI